MSEPWESAVGGGCGASAPMSPRAIRLALVSRQASSGRASSGRASSGRVGELWESCGRASSGKLECCPGSHVPYAIRHALMARCIALAQQREKRKRKLRRDRKENTACEKKIPVLPNIPSNPIPPIRVGEIELLLASILIPSLSIAIHPHPTRSILIHPSYLYLSSHPSISCFSCFASHQLMTPRSN